MTWGTGLANANCEGLYSSELVLLCCRNYRMVQVHFDLKSEVLVEILGAEVSEIYTLVLGLDATLLDRHNDMNWSRWSVNLP